MIKSIPSRKTVLKALGIGAFFFLFSSSASAQTIPLIAEGKGVHFEAGDGSAPPITLDSTEVIDVRLVSALETTTLRLESSSASSTILTIGGLSPERLYFIYTGDYHHKTIFTTDPEGRLAFTQDIANPQFLIIQPRESTYFIRDDTTGGDCVSIGIWNSATKTCVLTGNLAQTIQIDADGVTLDGGGYILSSPGSGMGVFLSGRKGVTIRNLTIKNFRDGIALVSSEGITVEGNTISEVGFGVSADTASSTNITKNTFTTLSFGISLLYSNANILSQNVITNFHSSGGISLSRSNKNTIIRNRIENGPTGITLQLSLNNTIQNNTIRNSGYYAMSLQYSQNNAIFQNNFFTSAIRHINSFNSVSLFNRALPDGGNYWDTYDKPAEGCTDTNVDGFCDTPLVLNRDNSDFFPWTMQDGWISTPDASSTLSYTEEDGFLPDTESPGIHPNKGTASSTPMMFKAVYTSATAPDAMNVLVGNGTASTSYSMMLDTTSASTTLRDGIFTNGEQYIATQTFPKGKYQYYFEAQSGSTAVRLPADGALSFQTGYSNVAFLPGLLGSRLYQQQLFENKLWEPNRNADVEKLYLTDAGESVNQNIYTNDIIDEAFGFNVYKEFSESMNALVNDGTINAWQAMPYDWRFDIEDIVNNNVLLNNSVTYNIAESIETLAESSANGEVAIIAHSNGGLLGKLLISKLEVEGKGGLIDKFIIVGTPQLGTPSAIMGLLHGGERGVLKGWLPNHEVTREFSENMQSAYNLLPSAKYFETVDVATQPIVEFDFSVSITDYLRNIYGAYITSSSALTGFLSGEDSARNEPAPSDVDEPNVLKRVFLDKAATLHVTLDSWNAPEGVEVIQIAGWGLDTLRGIRYAEQEKTSCNADLSACSKVMALDPQPLFTEDGDKTVVIPSATAMGGQKFYVNLPDYNHEGILNQRRNREHADILEVSVVQELIGKIIKNDTSPLPDHITSMQPLPNDVNKKLRIRVHSPVSLDLYDTEGNHTGLLQNPNLDSDIRLFEENIPNSYYLEMGEGKYAGRDTLTTTRIVLKGQSLGTFTLEIDEVSGATTTGTLRFKDIPITASSTITMDIQTIASTTPLQIDINGDGVVDFTLSSSTPTDSNISLEMLARIIQDMDIKSPFKKELTKDIERIQKHLKKEAKYEEEDEEDDKENKDRKEILEDFLHFEKDVRKFVKKNVLSRDDGEKLLQMIDTIREDVIK